MVTCAEETKQAGKIVPKAIILAFSICTLVYILVAIALLSLLPLEVIGKAPIAEAVVPHLGENFGLLLALGSLVAIGNGILVFLITGSRFVYGLASEKALPGVFSRINQKFRTPHLAILLVALVSIGFCFLGRNINLIANATNFAALIAFLFVNLSVIVLRIKNPNAVRWFKIPGSIKNIPITALLGAIASIALICSLGLDTLGLGLGLLTIGIIYYFLIARIHFRPFGKR
jgi:APA family basic amino acid/polyamine antiporter